MTDTALVVVATFVLTFALVLLGGVALMTTTDAHSAERPSPAQTVVVPATDHAGSAVRTRELEGKSR